MKVAPEGDLSDRAERLSGKNRRNRSIEPSAGARVRVVVLVVL